MSAALYWVVRCGSLFVGEGPAVRVGTSAQAKKFTQEEARKKVAALTSGNRARFPLPWCAEQAPDSAGGEK